MHGKFFWGEKKISEGFEVKFSVKKFRKWTRFLTRDLFSNNDRMEEKNSHNRPNLIYRGFVANLKFWD